MPADCTAVAPETLLASEGLTDLGHGWADKLVVERQAFAEKMLLKREATRPAFPTFGHAPYVAAITAATKAYDEETPHCVAHCIAEQFRDDDVQAAEDRWMERRENYQGTLDDILAIPASTHDIALLKVQAYFAGQGCTISPEGEITGPSGFDGEREYAFTSLWRDIQALAAASLNPAESIRSPDAQPLRAIAQTYAAVYPKVSDCRPDLPGDHADIMTEEACVMAELYQPSVDAQDLIAKAAMVRTFFDGTPPKFRDEMEDVGHRMAMTIVDDALSLAAQATLENQSPSSDAELLALAPELRLRVAMGSAAIARSCPDEELDAVEESTGEIAHTIRWLPAMSLEGFRLKAEAVQWANDGGPVDLYGEGSSTAHILASSLINELLGLGPTQNPAETPAHFSMKMRDRLGQVPATPAPTQVAAAPVDLALTEIWTKAGALIAASTALGEWSGNSMGDELQTSLRVIRAIHEPLWPMLDQLADIQARSVDGLIVKAKVADWFMHANDPDVRAAAGRDEAVALSLIRDILALQPNVAA